MVIIMIERIAVTMVYSIVNICCCIKLVDCVEKKKQLSKKKKMNVL